MKNGKQGIIIGAGIGGLTTAIALLRKGIDIIIYEQSEQIHEIGAGIWVAPNAMKVLDELGLCQDIMKAGRILEKVSIMDLEGRPISVIDSQTIKSKYKFSTVAIHRAILQKILISRIPEDKIVLSKKFLSYRQSDNSITALFEDGTSAEGDFIISADGIKSKARLQMHPYLNLRYSGQTCWRFVTDFELPSSEEGNMYEIWSNQKGLRVGYSKINDRQIYVFITRYTKAGDKDNRQSIKDDLLKLCSEFPPIVKEMILTVDSDSIIRNDLFDFKPIKKWTDGRIVLIGDAAHATTPNLGQGACQAIEDAYAIAAALSLSSDVETSFKIFEEKRIKRAAYITNTSWQYGQITNTSGWLKWLLMGIMRITPTFIKNKQLDRIYLFNY